MQALCVTTVMFLPFDITEKLSNFSPILDEMSRKYNVLLMVNYGYQDCTIKSLLHFFEKEIQRSRSFSYSEDLFHQSSLLVFEQEYTRRI